jgi:hypothetical protein
MKKYLKIIPIIIGFLIPNISFSQVVTDENPPSFLKTRTSSGFSIQTISIPKPDLDKLEKDDLIEDAIKDIPWRFGLEQKVNLNLNNSGTWTSDNSGNKTWFLILKSKDALSLNLNFDAFKLSPNAKLFIYNSDHSDVLGAITQTNNKENEEFAIRPIKGNSITLELVVPENEISNLKLNISGIVYGYRSIHNKATKAFGSSGSCNININCNEGNNWQDVKRSIVMILRANNTRWCSGALINNIRQDSTPYVLTANHCGLQTNSIFIFNYESPNCSPNADGVLTKSMSGATSKATHSNSDFHLFELNNTPPSSYEVFYAGWDRSNIPSTTSTGIHHPDGDVMKISIDSDSPITSGYYTTNGSTHWTVQDWDFGTTEGGSSGSPLFNEYQQIIGQLHGGNAACGNNSEDYYGKFSVSWNAISGTTNQLSSWLDPDNTGALSISGLDTKTSNFNNDLSLNTVISQMPYLCLDSVVSPSIIVKNMGNNTITSFNISYSSNGLNLGSIPWTGTLLRNQLELITIPSITLPNGANSVNYTISIPNGITDQDLSNNSFTAVTTVNKSPIFVTLKLKTDDYGDEISWNFNEQNTTTLIDNGGPYSQVNGGTIHTYNICLYDSCFNFNLFDSQGDGFNGIWGNGYALITNNNGDTLVYENSFTSAYKTNSFCVTNSTGIFEKELKNESITIFPNPINKGSVLQVNTTEISNLYLYDITGKLIFKSPNSKNLQINQKQGIYFLIGTSPGSDVILFTKKLIVQ